MFGRLMIAAGVWLVVGCGSSAGSDPGPLVDNTQWRQTVKGEEFFGAPPIDATCPPPEGECPDFETEECVDVPATCRVSFVAECLDAFTVLSVYTEVCDWITFEQASLRAIRTGDEIEIRTFHFQLTAPFDGEARLSLTLGDQMIFDERLLIPQPSGPTNGTWIATKDFEAGTPMLFHVNNHGNNEYLLIEVNVL
ncbi:MAG: hypothetical protein OEM15_04745 [Myxococcales bacterium]|nr:hypothetical protein [Myxococcales bacterium]MDH3484142.1 hypothetical protein [Myxococcales bacterium]